MPSTEAHELPSWPRSQGVCPTPRALPARGRALVQWQRRLWACARVSAELGGTALVFGEVQTLFPSRGVWGSAGSLPLGGGRSTCSACCWWLFPQRPPSARCLWWVSLLKSGCRLLRGWMCSQALALWKWLCPVCAGRWGDISAPCCDQCCLTKGKSKLRLCRMNVILVLVSFLKYKEEAGSSGSNLNIC